MNIQFDLGFRFYFLWPKIINISNKHLRWRVVWWNEIHCMHLCDSNLFHEIVEKRPKIWKYYKQRISIHQKPLLRTTIYKLMSAHCSLSQYYTHLIYISPKLLICFICCCCILISSRIFREYIRNQVEEYGTTPQKEEYNMMLRLTFLKKFSTAFIDFHI